MANLIIAGSSPSRVQEELARVQAQQPEYTNITTDVRPITDAQGNVTRPVSDTAPFPGAFGGSFQPTPTAGSLIAPTTPINSTVLAPQANLSGALTYPSTSSPLDISKLGIDASGQLQMTQPEAQAQTLTGRIQSLQDQLVGESTYRTQQEQAQNIAGQQKTVLDLSSQLKALQNENASITFQPAGVNQTATMLGAQQRELLNQNALKALSVNSLLEAARGNLSLSLDLADRAVKAQFDPIRERIAATKSNLDLLINSPEYSIADKNRALVQKAIQDAQSREVNKQEDNTKIAQAMAAAAIKNFPNNSAASFAATQVFNLKASDPDYLSKVFNLIGKYQADPAQIQKDLDAHLKSQADIALTYENIRKQKDLTSTLSIADAQKLGVPYGTTKEQAIALGKVPGVNQEANALKENAFTSAANLLDKLNTGKGTSVVGGSRFFGGALYGLLPGTDSQNFQVQFNNLKSLLSLENVKYLKGQGQVSDAERRLLDQASAKLSLSQSETEFKSALQDVVKALTPLKDQVNKLGYNYDQMKADGYSDEEIRQAIGQ